MTEKEQRIAKAKKEQARYTQYLKERRQREREKKAAREESK